MQIELTVQKCMCENYKVMSYLYCYKAFVVKVDHTTAVHDE